MSNYLNYLVEANLSLLIFFAAYTLVLRKETDFSVQRLFLLTGIIASLTFPLIHISYYQARIPSLSELIPTYLLPELTIGNHETVSGTQYLQDTVNIRFMPGLYITGLLFFLARFGLQLFQLTRKMKYSSSYRVGRCNVVESTDSNHTFSFFNFIFLGQSDTLTAEEKAKVIQHETVHARQFHSCDLLLVNVVGIFFWFNPILRLYKKTLIQLHEYEADARAVDNRETNAYCGLLAKVALQSADFPLANHFNSSLTLKRIIMMRTIKQKMKRWKMIIVAGIIPIVFFIVACQDQVVNSISKMGKIYGTPDYVQARYDQLFSEYPDSHFVLVEFFMDAKKEDTEQLLSTYEKQYGKPKSIELFNPDASLRTITGKLESGVVIKLTTIENTSSSFAIIEYNSVVDTISEPSKIGNDVYSVVDETAMPVGGLSEFFEFIGRNLRYPEEARTKWIEGKVFVEFIVDINGNIDVVGVSGIGGGCDVEAMRVVQSSPKWIPGKTGGIPVKQKMILPINFKIAGSSHNETSTAPEGTMPEVVVATFKNAEMKNNKD